MIVDRKLKILWIGPVADEAYLMRYSAAFSPAGLRWNRGFVEGLEKAGVEVRTVYHLARRAWPRGPLRVRRESIQVGTLCGSWPAYWNLKNIRSSSLASGYLGIARRWIAEGWRPDLVVVYNGARQNVETARILQRTAGIPWVLIHADGDHDAVAPVQCAALGALGIIFLSWHAFQHHRAGPQLHLDGGIDRCRAVSNPGRRSKNIVYAGALYPVAGADFLVRSFRRLKDPAARLHLTGKGATADLAALVRADSRITMHGLVAEAQLEEVCADAEIFVNPRPSRFSENTENFPSKLLDYLSWGRPVVSTMTPGVHPEYRAVLTTLEPETEEALANLLGDVLAWPNLKYREQAEKITAWTKANRLWATQVRRFLDWLPTI